MNPDTVPPEQVTVAPGLPESKVGTEGAGETLDVRMPSVSADEEIDQVIVRSFTITKVTAEQQLMLPP